MIVVDDIPLLIEYFTKKIASEHLHLKKKFSRVLQS
jgi:DNA-binding NtrC family response regulator